MKRFIETWLVLGMVGFVGCSGSFEETMEEPSYSYSPKIDTGIFSSEDLVQTVEEG